MSTADENLDDETGTCEHGVSWDEECDECDEQQDDDEETDDESCPVCGEAITECECDDVAEWGDDEPSDDEPDERDLA